MNLQLLHMRGNTINTRDDKLYCGYSVAQWLRLHSQYGTRWWIRIHILQVPRQFNCQAARWRIRLCFGSPLYPLLWEKCPTQVGGNCCWIISIFILVWLTSLLICELFGVMPVSATKLVISACNSVSSYFSATFNSCRERRGKKKSLRYVK